MGLMSPPRAQQALASNRRKHLVIIIVAVVFTMASLAAVWLYVQMADRRDAQTVRHALEQGQLDEASRVLEHWLGNRPQAAEAYYLKARWPGRGTIFPQPSRGWPGRGRWATPWDKGPLKPMTLEDGASPSTLVPQEPATAGDLSSRSAAQAKHLALRSTGHGTDARHSIPPAGTYATQSAYRGQGSFGFRAGMERSRIWLMAVSMRSASAGCPSRR